MHVCQVLQARQLASKRGVRNIAAEDLIFLIRYDRAKVNRLRTYLSWKDVRKNAKESDNAGGTMDDVMEEAGPGRRAAFVLLITGKIERCYRTQKNLPLPNRTR